MSEFLVWEDNDGNAVALKASGYGDNAYLKLADSFIMGGHPEKYFTVRLTRGYYHSSSKGIMSSFGFENPHNSNWYYHNGRLFRDRDSICLAFDNGDPIIFHGNKKISIPEDLIVPLPKIRKCTFLLNDGDETFIYVSRDKYEYQEDKFFIGKRDEMQMVNIIDYITYRDGGTTIIKTDIGELFVPTPFRKKDPTYKITFDDKRFWECEGLSVEEDENSAKIIDVDSIFSG